MVEQKKLSTMLVQAPVGEPQAARGLWASLVIKELKMLVAAGGEQQRQQVGVREGFRR